jgi:hypothetical protein
MNPLSKELEQLNAALFLAENKEQIENEQWDAFLRRVLSPDFIINRANRMMQTKEGMIEQIRGDNRERNEPANIDGGMEGNYAVVTSTITVKDDPKTYHNLKVFQRELTSGQWQCVYWRVVGLDD